MIKMDGFDDCIAGIVNDQSGRYILIYDRTKVIEKLIQQGMSKDEAIEFHYFNQDAACVGSDMPVFMDPYEEDALAE
jgi:biotin synthase-related radical SAM superfamily protein